MPPANDPHLNFPFTVEIDGVPAASFSEVSGLGLEIDVIEYRNGNEDITPRKLPGLKKYTNVTLKRGFTGDRTLWNWIRLTANGPADKRTVTITLQDRNRQPVLRFVLREAWPKKWEGPSLNARGQEVAIETLEIVHEGLDIDN